MLGEQRLQVLAPPRRRASGGTQTSSMISDAPGGTSRPSSPCIPSRTCQSISISRASRVNAGGRDELAAVEHAFGARASARRAPASSSAAELDQQRGRLGGSSFQCSGVPGMCPRRRSASGATISSVAVAPAATSVRHRAAAASMSAKNTTRSSCAAAAGPSRTPPRRRTRASPPSRRRSRRKISSGVVGVEERAQPVAGRVLDLELAPRRARRARRPRAARRGSRAGRARARARRRRTAPRHRARPCRSPRRRQHERQRAHRR